jgi:hypothetical protein
VPRRVTDCAAEALDLVEDRLPLHQGVSVLLRMAPRKAGQDCRLLSIVPCDAVPTEGALALGQGVISPAVAGHLGYAIELLGEACEALDGLRLKPALGG